MQQRKPLYVSSGHTEAWHPGSPDCQDGERSSASLYVSLLLMRLSTLAYMTPGTVRQR